MSILDRIISLLGNADQKQLTDHLGLKKTAFTDWKSGKSHSYRRYLIEISDYFNVSLDYLVYGKENTEKLSDDVRELLDFYNMLSDIDRGKLLGKAEALAELATERKTAERAAEQPKKLTKIAAPAANQLPSNEQEVSETCEITYFDYPTSAGTGLFLDEAIAEKLTVKASPEALSADYAIPISGDSMEPDYSSGDIVLVKSCPSVSEGKIGIFVLDGEAYIKEYGGNCLISHNQEYSPIMLKEYKAAVCLGLVLGKAEVIE